MERITSRHNAIVSRYRDAARGTVAETILLDGTHLVSDALVAGLRVQHVLASADALEQPEVSALVEQIVARHVPVAAAARRVMDAVSPVRSSSPVVALADRPKPDTDGYRGDAALVVIVCGVQDPGNVGAIIRSAEGAGATGVVLAGQCADPFAWKALRGSMGSALRVPLAFQPTVDAAVADARRHRAAVVATVPHHGVPLFDACLIGTLALLVGGEGAGLPDAVVMEADLRIAIPMAGPIESLNAAVATAVVLYEALRQRTRTASTLAGITAPQM